MSRNGTPALLQSGEEKPDQSLQTCFRCGVCCAKYQVNLSLVEARDIAANLRFDWDKFLEECTDPRWPGTSNLLLRKVNGVCIFLKQADGCRETSCLIHAFRPSSCVDWTPSLQRAECKEGLARYWGLSVDSSGGLLGDEERIKRFQCFVLSLQNAETNQKALRQPIPVRES